MDGLRKVPDISLIKMLRCNRCFSTKVPDPFEKFESFGSHNNNKLKIFFDRFVLSILISATDCYTSGKFDDALTLIWKSCKNKECYFTNTWIERQKHSLFYQFAKRLKYYTNVISTDENNSITYKCPLTNKEIETSS